MNKKSLPLMALRDMVVFPGVIAPIFVGRKKSLQALSRTTISEENNSKYILVTLQKKFDQENPSKHELYNTAILAKIIQIVKLPNNTAKILIEAVARVKLSNIKDEEAFEANYEIIPDEEILDIHNMRSLVDNAVQLFSKYAMNDKKVNAEIIETINKEISNRTNFINIINILSSHLITSLETKQQLLEETNPVKRITTVITTLTSNIVNSETEHALQQRVRKQIEKTQRDYYLHEQMKAIQKELDEDKSELADIEKKIKSLKLSKEAKEKAESEFKKLRAMNQMSAESGVTRNYLETLLSLPWGKYDNSKIDINQAEKILNRDHFGLEKVKERIIEYLAVLQRSSKIRGPILCLIGPPGVGKTSLVKSIAEGMGRKYTKFSLGGVRDEAEIRGHRKTYLGSMPGKILGQLKKIKTSNPVMLLDEIDKMSSDFRGDPASALLEVLDPEQNSHFVDHYLEVEYDLSNVVFIATANSHDLPRALSDRMEKIYISGYVEEEKLQIAKNYLVPKQFKMHKIKEDEITISEAAILDLIRYYTKESGVRALEREICALTRKALKQILANKTVKHISIDSNNLEEFLGAKKYNFGLAEKEDQIGSTTGLAYTEVGGELLTIEALAFSGKGEIKTTGKLGDVMKESAMAAYSCFRSRATNFGLKYDNYKDFDIHIHVPAGAIPKDGPSAGCALFTTIVSLMTKIPVHRTVAMTGEITLRGNVLPIGGLKEKLLAASRGGIKTVLIPEENVKDLKDIPPNIKENLEIISVSNIDQVLKHALVEMPINKGLSYDL
ncbi:endopeptidase La [Rickettsia prowazekii]|uniref:Lon protease n=1 Tax=Rickettsia prowazekii (strain Madrid E) TaxID=272947 RepID=LON_RICPR|nr:endopeptidase La [Rickettsia prowazekii]Q9ZD92.1 RecName: Full=Lon protease; AltName: Full=ATP-dependent protease La [Rickettsia prowazekii str. Madrid E]EOB09817.1 Threonine dehydratase [Rickettsia prowazekii str. GvF12]AFE49263.1 ATP-dependent protease La [Rickettsia prowazekii str. Chernikova]AFE50109.1 ATP-dependent protease La [Rickettsia prowazekii str. Katsinyian]AFE50954.1 ATP-dependent protease La [Rickettsia prowazekii str. BuV67-CWPP]AFE51790.1 ATP-dependent protease La [Rickett